MGTNYYIQRKDPKTGRCKDVHICKTSYGWSPNLVGYKKDINIWSYEDLPEIKSWTDWKWFLMREVAKGGIIFDEYDEPHKLRHFFRFIQDFKEIADKKNYKNHAKEMLNGNLGVSVVDKTKNKYWVDEEGYSFSAVEFS